MLASERLCCGPHVQDWSENQKDSPECESCDHQGGESKPINYRATKENELLMLEGGDRVLL